MKALRAILLICRAASLFNQPLTTPNSPLRGTYSNFELRTQNSQLREALQFLTRRRAAPTTNPKPLTYVCLWRQSHKGTVPVPRSAFLHFYIFPFAFYLQYAAPVLF